MINNMCGLRGFLALIESDLDYDLCILNIEKKMVFKTRFRNAITDKFCVVCKKSNLLS